MATSTIPARPKPTIGTVSGTTTSTGAILIPTAMRDGFVSAWGKSGSMLVFRRDDSYLTCYNNTISSGVLANQAVEVYVAYYP